MGGLGRPADANLLAGGQLAVFISVIDEERRSVVEAGLNIQRVAGELDGNDSGREPAAGGDADLLGPNSDANAAARLGGRSVQRQALAGDSQLASAVLDISR